MRQNRDCRAKLSRTCADCGQKLCWQHLKLKCPQGRRTKYGSWQHLSREQKYDITKATQFKLHKVRLTSETEELEKLTVDIRYLTADGVTSTLVIYPGGIQSAGDDENWEPDDELRRWIDRRNGSAPQTFTSRDDAITVVTTLLRTMRQKPTGPTAPNT